MRWVDTSRQELLARRWRAAPALSKPRLWCVRFQLLRHLAIPCPPEPNARPKFRPGTSLVHWRWLVGLRKAADDASDEGEIKAA